MLDYIYLRLAAWQDRITPRLQRLRVAVRSFWLCHGDHADELILTTHKAYLHCAVCQRDTAGWHLQLIQRQEVPWHPTRTH